MHIPSVMIHTLCNDHDTCSCTCALVRTRNTPVPIPSCSQYDDSISTVNNHILLKQRKRAPGVMLRA